MQSDVLTEMIQLLSGKAMIPIKAIWLHSHIS